MEEVKNTIKIGNHDIRVQGIDDGRSYSVKAFYKTYYLPPTYSYNHTDFTNLDNSYASGLFYGNLNQVMSNFINIIKTDPGMENKFKIIDDFIKNKK